MIARQKGHLAGNHRTAYYPKWGRAILKTEPLDVYPGRRRMSLTRLPQRAKGAQTGEAA